MFGLKHRGRRHPYRTTAGDSLPCLPLLIFQPLSSQRSPNQISPQVLPKALQSPDHMQLPVRKMLQEAIADEPGDILPIVVAFVSQFLLEYGTNGNHCRESIAEDHELKKE